MKVGDEKRQKFSPGKNFQLYHIAGNIRGWPPNHHCKNIGEFKFGGSVILADYNLIVAKVDHQTTKFSGNTVWYN